MTYHNKAQDTVVQELSSDRITGLTSTQVEEKRAKFGENRLREKKKKTNFQRFLDQFKDAMILILLAAAAISFVVAATVFSEI